MKVKVEVTLDINVDSWCLNYGTNPNEVRADAKDHAIQSLTEHFRDLGLLKEGN